MTNLRFRAQPRWVRKPTNNTNASNTSSSCCRFRVYTSACFISACSFWFLFVYHKSPEISDRVASHSATRLYDEWRRLAVHIATLPCALAIEEMDKDPFGVRKFEQQLLQKESEKGAILEIEELKSLFPCPVDDRITLPDQRDVAKATAFREGQPGTFLFFQHLRKAGGTNFCSLAQNNLPKAAVPRYYCMSDWFWTHDDGRKSGGAGYLQHWTNDEILSRMNMKGHRVIGNEWDNFDRFRHFDLPAVFATSFRRPMDRALSQFRFECIEDRGCEIKDVGEWWDHRKDLYNIYTRTFATIDASRKLLQAFEGNSSADGQWRGQLIGDALDTVIRFHLVLTMEWLAYAKPQVEAVLGFHDTTTLTQRVRPHIGQFNRNDGQEVNKLGAAGIAKASWKPEDYLSPEQYENFRRHLLLDEILTDAARRIVLERFVCDDLKH